MIYTYEQFIEIIEWINDERRWQRKCDRWDAQEIAEEERKRNECY